MPALLFHPSLFTLHSSSMLTRDDFTKRFSRNAVIGMVHVGALPGSPRFEGSISAVIEAAIRDARALREGGCDAMAFENFGDRPFFKECVPAETIAGLTRVIAEVVAAVPLPFGVNVLRNDAASAVAIAATTGAAFIRVNVHTGAMITDQGIIEGRAADTLRKRAALCPDVLIFADHMVKHAAPLAAVDEVRAAKDLRNRGLADGIIISGSETGAEADRTGFEGIREALADAPILIGSGLSEGNAAAFRAADGAIVGTSIKIDGRVEAPVDPDRVARLVAAFKRTPN
jgi:membrane complex biogenesis BtpA family protein